MLVSFALATALMAPLADLPKLAVLPLRAKRVDKELVTALDERLLSMLGEQTTYEILSPSDIRGVLDLEKYREVLSCEDASCLLDLSGALGADLLLTGTVSRLGDTLLVNMTQVHARTAEVRGRGSQTIPNDERLLEPALRVAVGAALDLNVSDVDLLTKLQPVPSVEPAWAPSLLMSMGLVSSGALSAGLGAYLGYRAGNQSSESSGGDGSTTTATPGSTTGTDEGIPGPDPDPDPDPEPEPEPTPEGSRVSKALMIAGAVVAAVGVGMWVWSLSESDDDEVDSDATATQAYLVPTGAGFVFGLRFP